MLFKKLKLKNIRSYDSLEIEFPKGLVLLSGNIGSGKTSILLGLQFALFGLQPGQKGSSILRSGEDEASASLEMEIDGKSVTLERAIKKSKNGSITQDLNIISVDGQIEELSTLEMKERVVSLLNYPREFIKKSNQLYKFTVYTPQEEMKAIIQERPEVRLDTLRHIFGIDRYKRIKENSAVFLQRIKDSIKIKEVLITEMNLLKEKFVLENEKKIVLSREVNNLNIDYQKLILEKELAEKKLLSAGENMEERRKIDSEILNLQIQIIGKKDMENRMKKEISLMQKQIGEVVDFSVDRLKNVSELLDKHKLILEEKTKEYNKLNSQIFALESKKERPLELRDKVMSLENCPTCFQGVSHEHKEKISKRTSFEIEELVRELEVKIIQRTQISRELEKEKELVKGYESDKTVLQQNKIRFEHQKNIEVKMKSDAYVLDRISNEIKSLSLEMDEKKLKILPFNSSQKLFDEAKLEFQKIDEISRTKEIAIASKNKELEILKKRLEELGGDISGKEKIREQMNKLKLLEGWINDKFIRMIEMTEKNVLSRLRNEFSRILGDWFSLMVPDSLSVRLDEDFTPIVTNQDYEIDYDFLSGGERTAIALAYRLALNQVLNSMLSHIKTKDVVILDEPTDGFASEQVDKMRDIFEQLSAEQIILVSHEEKMEGFVDHVLRVRKEGVSRVS